MILGIDIGGTTVKLGLIDPAGNILKRYEASVCYDNYATPVLATVVREARLFSENCHAAIEGVGVSATGQIDVKTGAVIGTNGKIPHYEGSEIKKEMACAFGLPTVVLNDANAAVLGEYFAGRAKGKRHVVMVTLGTGVGGGVIVDGRLLTGASGIAGELGHFTLYQNGLPCACGKRGCYECYAAATALSRRVYEKTNKRLDGMAIFERLRSGDNTLNKIFDQWIDDIAAGLSGLVHIFNPEIVLIGGGVSRQEDLLIAPLRERVLETVMPRFAEHLQIDRGVLGNDAGMIGAAAFWLESTAAK